MHYLQLLPTEKERVIEEIYLHVLQAHSLVEPLGEDPL